jgi:hypothetical protein
MTVERRQELRKLEGRSVHLSLTGGTRLDDVSLVSARTTTLWVFTNGEDTFVPVDHVVDFWESATMRSAA